MTIDQFHDSLRQLANVGQSQYFPPEELDLVINNAINDLFKQEFKHFEATQEISDTLGYYKVTPDPINVDVNGQITLPTDFYHLVGIEAILEDDSRKKCQVLKDTYWLDRKHSKGYPPSTEWPIARQMGSKKVEALPIGSGNIKSLVINYLRKPAVAKFDYTIDPSGTGWTYNEGTSTQVDWPEIGHTQIQDKAVGFLGVTLRDNVLIGNETVRKSQNEE